MLSRAPCPALRPFVAKVWASDERTEPGGRERVLPTGCMHLVFRFSAPLQVFDGEHDARGRIVGHAIVGHNAGELIALWSLAIANRLDIQAIAELDAPYPSRSAISKSVAETFGEDGLTPNLRRRIIEFLRKFG